MCCSRLRDGAQKHTERTCFALGDFFREKHRTEVSGWPSNSARVALGLPPVPPLHQHPNTGEYGLYRSPGCDTSSWLAAPGCGGLGGSGEWKS